MLRKLFDTPLPDAASIVLIPVQSQALAQIREYWITRAWQLVLGEVVLWAATVYRDESYQTAYLIFAVLIGVVYLLGTFTSPLVWLIGMLTLFGIQGSLVNGLGAVTALSYMVPYTIAGMILNGRARLLTQVLCVFAFWMSLIYEALPVLPQLDSSRYVVVSYDILIAAFTFQTLRYLSTLTVEINNAHVAQEVQMQSHQFLARVSHELRTPLNSMLGFSKLLRRADLTDRHKEYLRQVIDEGEHLNRLVSDLLDSAHLSTGKMTLVKEECDLNDICQVVADEHQTALADDVALKTEFASNSPLIQADPIRLRQAIGNLVSNAVKHTSSGTVTIQTQVKDGSVLISITDTGAGITEEQQTLIFVPFVQLDSTKAGVGLGWDIALQLIRLHGGDIHLTSTFGQGSTFTIELPIRSPSA